MLLLVFLIINALLGIYIAFLKPDAYALEQLKVGGRENMKMAQQLYQSDVYKTEQSNTLSQILASMNQAVPTQELVAETPAKVLDASKLEAMTKNIYLKWKKDARITVIEYSDLLCPFCKRHHNDQTVSKLVEKYPNDVNITFKQFPIPQLHPTAPLWAQAVLCAGKVAGTAKFYEYLDKAFQMSDFTEDNVVDLAKQLKINTAKFASCLTSPDTIAQVNTEIQEAQSFGINGTPGNLIIDNSDGTYVIVSGAYPIDAFVAEIDKMLAK